MTAAASLSEAMLKVIRYTFIGCDNPAADGRLGFLAVRPTPSVIFTAVLSS